MVSFHIYVKILSSVVDVDVLGWQKRLKMVNSSVVSMWTEICSELGVSFSRMVIGRLLSGHATPLSSELSSLDGLAKSSV